MRKIIPHILALLLLMIFMNSCFSDYSKSELAGRTFYADDGAIIRLNADGSCELENINWEDAYGSRFSDLVDSLKCQKTHLGTWELNELDKQVINIVIKGFDFDVYLSSSNIILPTSADDVILIIYGDTEKLYYYEFKQKK
jgi:hypothetical protein